MTLPKENPCINDDASAKICDQKDTCHFFQTEFPLLVKVLWRFSKRLQLAIRRSIFLGNFERSEMRNHIFAMFLLAAGTAVSAPAVAFQELPASPDPQTTIVIPGDRGQALTDGEQAKPTKTAEKKDGALKIPGLGSLDFLPKLDFGLDVMYGASPDPAAPDTALPDTRGDDMMIRGTLKRRF